MRLSSIVWKISSIFDFPNSLGVIPIWRESPKGIILDKGDLRGLENLIKSTSHEASSFSNITSTDCQFFNG